MIKTIFQKMSSIPKDKLAHSFYGSLIFSLSLFLFSVNIAFVIVNIIAISKEIYDQYDYNGADVIDYLFTIFIPSIITLYFWVG